MQRQTGTSRNKQEQTEATGASGAGWAIALNLVIFAAIAALTVWIERRRHDRLVDEPQRAPHASPWLHGPWPLFVGAIALVLLNFATLALSGHP